MTPQGIRLIPRIALFSAIIYIFSWATSFLLNVSLIFFIVFSCGYMWGFIPGIITGAVGMGLTTLFNPYGPAMPPIMIVQILGIMFSGAVGAFCYKYLHQNKNKFSVVLILISASLACTIGYYLPLNTVDAWLFQPFWERFVVGSLWSLISVGSNIIIFTLLYPLLISFYEKERRMVC